MDIILKRRSIRKYQNKKITKTDIEEILKAAMYAPSAGNEQPWEFIVIDDRAILDIIPTVHPYAQMLKEAPLAILVCFDLNKDHYYGYYLQQDCAAATQNLLLAATVKGIGSVWLGVYPDEKRVEDIRKLFNLPENIKPFSLISLGFPNETKTMPERFDINKIHYNNW